MFCRLEETTLRGIIIALSVIKMPPRTCSRKFHRISTKVLLIIPIISQIWLITCNCFSLNGTLLNTLNGYTLFGNSSPPTTTTTTAATIIKTEPYYPNHRMDVGDAVSSHQPTVFAKSNTSLRYQDRETSGSILRPQLALQIYTNSNPPSNHMQDDNLHKSQPSQAHISAAIKPSSTMVILPAMSKSEHNTDHPPSDRKRHHHHQDRGSSPSSSSPSSTSSSDRPNDGLHSRGQHSSSRVNSQARNSNNNKLNHWHYVTDQTASSNSVESFAGTSGRDVDSFTSRGSGGSGNNGSPLINAIITVPTPTSEHHHHHHHNQQQQNYPFNQASEDNSTALQSSIEQTIARLMDDSSNSNIEFSMNLNGDEIIINPVPVGRGRGAIISGSLNGTKLNLHETIENQDESLLPRRYRAGVGKVDGGRSSRKNQPSESDSVVGDQQSASEIDLIDGSSSEGDGDDLDFDHSAASKGVQNGPPRLTKPSSHRGPSRNYHVQETNSQLEDDGDEPATNESNQDGRVTKVGYSRTNHNDDKRTGNSVGPGKQQQQIQGAKRKNQAAARKITATGSKRRPVYRSEDREFDLDPDERVISSSTSASGKRRDSDKTDAEVPSVTIKGEDVKRFEQLLENLRSLSLNSASGGKTKRNLQTKEAKRTQAAQKTSTQSSSSDSDDLDDQYQSKGEDAPSSSYSKKTWSNGESMTTTAQQDKKGQGNRQSDGGGGGDGETNDDCERRRRQQQSSKSNGDSDSSNGSYESDSSPNIVEQDPMTSSDGVDDLNDDASTQSQTSEQEDPGSSNQNVSLPITTKTTEVGSASELAEQAPSEQDRERQQPDGDDGQTGGRKSALQAYYDSQDNAISGGDDLKAIHRTQHDTLHDRHSGLDGGNSDPAADSNQPTTTGQQNQRKVVTITRTRQTPADGPQLNNYIDYSSLDDGEIYRVSESKRVRTVLPPRKYMDRMRSQRLVGRAANGDERYRGRIVADMRE